MHSKASMTKFGDFASCWLAVNRIIIRVGEKGTSQDKVTVNSKSIKSVS